MKYRAEMDGLPGVHIYTKGTGNNKELILYRYKRNGHSQRWIRLSGLYYLIVYRCEGVDE